MAHRQRERLDTTRGECTQRDRWRCPTNVDLVVRNGYAALAFDLRGHGLSTIRDGQPFPVGQFTPDDLNDIPKDVAAAISWIKTRPEADPTRIAVMGADLGANVAFVSAGIHSEVKTAVSISPEFRENQEQQVLVGTNLEGFQPSNILYLAAFGDQYAYTSSETMSGLTLGRTRVVGFQGVAHGLELLSDVDVWNEILSWLAANL